MGPRTTGRVASGARNGGLLSAQRRGIDGALHVVARLLGRDVADQTARYMEYRWTPEPYVVETYVATSGTAEHPPSAR
jgi:hypothetical protein